MITGLQEALPKSIGLLPFDGGVTGIFYCRISLFEGCGVGMGKEVSAPALPNCIPILVSILEDEECGVGLLVSVIPSIQIKNINTTYTGCMRHIKEQLNWTSKTELKQEVLQGIKEIGSILYWMGLLDIVLVSTVIFFVINKFRCKK